MGVQLSPISIFFLILAFTFVFSTSTSGKWKERPSDDNDENKTAEDDVPVVITPTIRRKPNMDPYRCDHLLSFPNKRVEFVECCRTFPRGYFVCPRFAPPGHVCGIPHPPDCCHNCPPPPTTTTTTTTTTPKPKAQDDEDDDDEDDEEE